MDAPFQGYTIWRDSSDPTATLHFYPPKDSDDLFDALRAKYPLVESHSERMRDAMIDFFMEEQQAELMSSSASSASPFVTDTASASPWQHSWPSMSATFSSVFTSPELHYADTSASVSSQSPAPQTAACSTTQSTPQLAQMTGVFSVTTSQPRQHFRRKMTDAEKDEYRLRRIVKACEKCARRKRKCNHNQPAMESVLSRNNKVTKDRAPPSARLSTADVVRKSTSLQDTTFFNDPLTSDMQLFDDFTTIFEDSLFDDTFEYGTQPTHAQPQRVPSAPALNTATNARQSERGESRRLQRQHSVVEDFANHDNAHQAPSRHENPLVQRLPSQERPVPTHTSHTHEFVGSGAYQYDGNSGPGSLNGIGANIDQQETRSRVNATRSGNASQQDGNAVNAAQSQAYGRASVSGEGRVPKSVSVFSSSNASTSPQGRPSPGDRPSFASAMSRAADPRTELYMLRRRGIPNLAARNPVANAAIATQRDVHATATAGTLGGLGVGSAQDLRSGISRDASPVHTRGRNPSDSGSAGDHRGTAGGLQSVTPLATDSAQAPYFGRLRDTNRHKDHHGRLALLQIIAMVLTAGVALALFGQTAGLLFLATCAPIASQRKEKTKDIMAPLASLMQTLQV